MRKAKKIGLTMLAGLLAAVAATGQSLELKDGFRQAVQGALLEEATAAFSGAPIPAGTPVAILPILPREPVPCDGDGWLAGQLKIALTRAGKNCVEGKEDPMWDEVQKEVTWDAHKEAFLDPETIDTFGKIQSAKILVSGVVRSMDYTDRFSYFEMELHATDISTKRHLWGTVVAKRYYLPGVEGVGDVSTLDPDLRDALQNGLRQKLSESLSGTAGLQEAGRVATLPLAADVKGYVGGLLRDSLLKASLRTVNADWGTLGEARTGLRDPTGRPADAVLHGSVRDLSVSTNETPTSILIDYRAELQTQIEKEGSELAWSDTITVQGTVEHKRGFWGTLKYLFPVLERKPWLAVVVPLGALALLVLFLKFLSAVTRVR